MKKAFLFLLTLFCCFSVSGQTKQGINYQALISTKEGKPLKNQAVFIRINLLENNPTGTSIYEETHDVVTNDFGLINLVIGRGSSGADFNKLNWLEGQKYVQVEYRLNNENYILLGTSELLSVPYAMFAKHAESISFSEELQEKIKNVVIKDEALKEQLISYILSKEEINNHIIQLIANSTQIQEKIISYVLSSEEVSNHIIEIVTNSSEIKEAFKGDILQSEDFKNQVKEYLLTDLGYFSAGTSQIICGVDESISLNASPLAEGEEGVWSVSPTEGTSFSDVGDPKSTFLPAGAGTYLLTWTVKNGIQEKSGNFAINVQEASLTAEILSHEINGVGSASLLGNVSSSVTGTWSIIEGTGGSLSTNIGNLTSLTGIEGNLYKVVLEASNHCASASDTVEIYFPDGEYMLDSKDGQKYKIVQIGNQTWMAENYNYASAASLVHPEIPAGEEKKYGRLYTLEDARSLAPNGWRLPTLEDYVALADNFYNCSSSDFCSSSSPEILLEGGSSHFYGILGGGFNPSQNSYYSLNEAAYYWTSTESTSDAEQFYVLYMSNNDISKMMAIGSEYYMEKARGISVRYIKE